MIRGLPGGSRFTALSDVHDALWKPSSGRESPGCEVVLALTRLYCMDSMENAGVHRSPRS